MQAKQILLQGQLFVYKNLKKALENLYSYTTIDNIYSSKTALSIGMKKIKEFKEENILYVVYELNRKDWQNLH